MITIENLNAFGADTSTGLNRCVGNEALYLRLVNMVPDDPHFDELKQFTEENNLNAAFEAAHALKGILANLSLTPLLTPVAELTEILRAKTQMPPQELLNELWCQREKLRILCEN